MRTMMISRHEFLRYCTRSAAALGLGAADLIGLERAMGQAVAKTRVLWLIGSSCSGCSVSFLNRFTEGAPATVADVLLDVVDLRFHPTLMAAAGQTALAVLQDTYRNAPAKGYVLVVEGGVPTAFGGHACTVWTDPIDGSEATFLNAVRLLAARASKIVCVGTCSAFGGIPAAYPNPTKIVTVKQATGRATINVPGCPPHPDWMVSVVAKLIAGSSIGLDQFGRPKYLFSTRVHERCPLKERDKAKGFARQGCLEDLGCRGPETTAPCPQNWFNGGQNWCIGAGGPCIGCTEPTFPIKGPLFKHEG